MPMDNTNLTTTLGPGLNETVLVNANVDLWTSNAGYNQDVAIFVSVASAGATLVAWKESGGFGGTFSPNAAFVQAEYTMTSGHTYVFTVQWKANHLATGATIWAGAGPINTHYSSTRLSVLPG
jgi:hypothetical protein